MRNSKSCSSSLPLCVNDYVLHTRHAQYFYDINFQFPFHGAADQFHTGTIKTRCGVHLYYTDFHPRVVKKLRRSISLEYTHQGGGRSRGDTNEPRPTHPSIRERIVAEEEARDALTMKKCSWSTHIKHTLCISDRKTRWRKVCLARAPFIYTVNANALVVFTTWPLRRFIKRPDGNKFYLSPRGFCGGLNL